MFKGHPKGLVAAALSNMGERFGYYIMNAVLLLFLFLNLDCRIQQLVLSIQYFTALFMY